MGEADHHRKGVAVSSQMDRLRLTMDQLRGVEDHRHHLLRERLRKRFLFKEINDAFHKVGDFFTKTYNSAKDAFKKLTSKIDFDAAVNALVPYIHSGMTVTACTGVCTGAAVSVLGPAATLA